MQASSQASEPQPASSGPVLVLDAENMTPNVNASQQAAQHEEKQSRISFASPLGDQQLYAIGQSANRHLDLCMSNGKGKGFSAACLKICSELNMNPLFSGTNALKSSTADVQVKKILAAATGFRSDADKGKISDLGYKGNEWVHLFYAIIGNEDSIINALVNLWRTWAK
jgi:hypothetical protein